jgi:hypothetical protein
MNPRILSSAVALTIACALPFAGGCVWTPELASVKQDIARQIPGTRFDHEMSFAIGWLKDVSRVEVAVYELDTDEPSRPIQTPSRIEEMLKDGWEMAARVRERDESVWVLYRVDDDSVREVFVVALDREELTMVKVKGRLERLIGRALTERRWHNIHSSIDTTVPASARTARS